MTKVKNPISPEAAIKIQLDAAMNYLHRGLTFDAFSVLGNELTQTWANAISIGAEEDIRSTALNHEIFSLIQQDPYSWRAFNKPRGYAGDAVMLDFVYSGTAPPETTEIGRTVFAGTTRGPMGLSVIFRRNLLTAHINQAVSTIKDYRILSVASGHCREVESSLLAEPNWRHSGQFVAFDQDQESCKLVEAEYGHLPLTVICSSVRKLLLGSSEALGTFDFIYSAGLFDYLADPLASKLIESLSELIRPGGKLLIGNFAPSSFGRGYMELLLDWKLIYRSTADLSNLFLEDQKNNIQSYIDPHGNVAYVEWTAPYA